MMGQPVLGNRKSVLEVSAEDIKRWIAQNYFTSNLVVVATGEIEHDKFVN
jgi:predicted Zn-dependent peptidase